MVRFSIFHRLRGDSSAEPILTALRAAGASFRSVVFTRNRRTMVSVGDGGSTLRLHECFRDAPPEVLRAVADLVTRTRAPGRDPARATIRAFLADSLSPRAGAAPPPPGGTRPRRVPKADRPHLARLQAEFDRVNEEHFGDALPRIHLALSGRMRRRNGHFSASPLEIVISRALCQKALDGEAEKTVRHEMIHLWQFVQGRKPGHGKDFRQWARALDVHPRATRSVAWKC
jgi:hypothetical protein